MSYACPECHEPIHHPSGCENPGCPAAYFRTPSESAALRRREADRLATEAERARFAALRAASFGGAR